MKIANTGIKIMAKNKDRDKFFLGEKDLRTNRNFIIDLSATITARHSKIQLKTDKNSN